MSAPYLALVTQTDVARHTHADADCCFSVLIVFICRSSGSDRISLEVLMMFSRLDEILIFLNYEPFVFGSSFRCIHGHEFMVFDYRIFERREMAKNGPLEFRTNLMMNQNRNPILFCFFSRFQHNFAWLMLAEQSPIVRYWSIQYVAVSCKKPI